VARAILRKGKNWRSKKNKNYFQTGPSMVHQSTRPGRVFKKRSDKKAEDGKKILRKEKKVTLNHSSATPRVVPCQKKAKARAHDTWKKEARAEEGESSKRTTALRESRGREREKRAEVFAPE